MLNYYHKKNSNALDPIPFNESGLIDVWTVWYEIITREVQKHVWIGLG